MHQTSLNEGDHPHRLRLWNKPGHRVHCGIDEPNNSAVGGIKSGCLKCCLAVSHSGSRPQNAIRPQGIARTDSYSFKAVPVPSDESNEKATKRFVDITKYFV